MSKRVITLLFTSGLLLITLFAVYRLIQHKQEVTITPPPPPRTVLVRVEPVVLQPRTHYVEALGTVTPFRQTRISAEVEGEVVALSPRTELGSEVKQGEELARLKDTPFRLDLEKQRALLQRQKALYQAELLASQREERLLAIARRQFQLARSEWQRREQLWKRGILSAQEYEAARQSLEAARAELQRAEQALERSRTGSVQVSRADIAAAEAAVALAEERLRNTVIRAPFAGILTERLIDLGQRVRPGEPLFTLIDISRVKIRSHVPSSAVGLLREGQQALLSVDTYPGQEFPGRLAHIGKAGDVQNRTFPIEVLFENPQAATPLLPGMFARIRIVVEHFPRAIFLPVELLQQAEGEGYFVYTADQTRNRAVKRHVVLGPSLEEGYIIRQGLQAGDLLIVEGYDLVSDGTPISIQNLQAAASRE